MKKALKIVKCDKCEKQYASQYFTFLALPDDKKYLPKVKDFSIYESFCPFCENKNILYYPITLIDYKRKYALISNPLDKENLGNYKVRIIKNGMELIEKQAIFSDHLNEQVLQTIASSILYKIKSIGADLQDDVYYIASDDKKMYFQITSSKQPISFDFEIHNKVLNILENKNVLIKEDQIPLTKTELKDIVNKTIDFEDIIYNIDK